MSEKEIIERTQNEAPVVIEHMCEELKSQMTEFEIPALMVDALSLAERPMAIESKTINEASSDDYVGITILRSDSLEK